MKCSNCDKEADGITAVVVYNDQVEPPIATICAECQLTVLTMKIVLTRSDTNRRFTFDGYLPVASKR